MRTHDLSAVTRKVAERTPQQAPVQSTADVDAEVGVPAAAFMAPAAGYLVGSADDAAEHQADRLAARAVARLHVDAALSDTAGMPTPHSVVRRSTRPAPGPIGLAGGALDSDSSQVLARARHAGGRPLDSDLRQRFGAALGADVSAARIHDDDDADRLSRTMSATAFTSESHVFFSRGSYDPGTPGGAQVLAHELAHVVQGSNGRTVDRFRSAEAPIRRKIGFELEEGNWHPFEKVIDEPLNWNQGFKPDGPGANSVNIFERKGQHVDDDVAQYGATSYTKKAALHQGTGFKLESDGPYTRGEMSIEFVTEPFDETAEGEKALRRAFDEIGKIMHRLNKLGREPHGYVSGNFVLPKDHKLGNQSLLLAGGSPNTDFKMQVTHGVKLKDIPGLFETFGTGVAEAQQDAIERAPARSVMSKKDKLQNTILGSSPAQARRVVIALQKARVLDEHPAEEVVGFFTYVLAYLQWVQVLQMDGLKLALPFMSRYDFARLLAMIPVLDRAALQNADRRDDVLMAVDNVLHTMGVIGGEKFNTKQGNQRTKPLGVHEPLMEFIPLRDMPSQKMQLYTLLSSMTAGTWLSGVLDGEDRLTGPGLMKYAADEGGALGATAKKYEKSVNIFSRGHGSSGTVVGDDRDLAVMENRLVDPEALLQGGLGVEKARAVAMSYFAYMRAVREYGADKATFPTVKPKK